MDKETEIVQVVRSNQQAIAENRESIMRNGEAIEVNRVAIAKNGEAIAENRKAIAKNGEAIAENRKAIAKNGEAIGENREAIAKNGEAIAENREAIAENRAAIEVNRQGIEFNGKEIARLEKTLDRVAVTVVENSARIETLSGQIVSLTQAHERTFQKIDDFVKLYTRHDVEIVALQSSRERIEERVVRLENIVESA